MIIPNAAVVATPTLINSLIGLTKGTSLAFSAGVVEVFAQAQILGGADYRYFERFISVALVYWVVNIGIESLGRFHREKNGYFCTRYRANRCERRPSLMIKISNLSKSFSGQTVLDHLNLDIQKGEVVALIGSSGAGKSTFLRSLNYLETPDSGSIQIDDFLVDFLKSLKKKSFPYAVSCLWYFSSLICLSAVQHLIM